MGLNLSHHNLFQISVELAGAEAATAEEMAGPIIQKRIPFRYKRTFASQIVRLLGPGNTLRYIMIFMVRLLGIKIN